MKKVAIFTEGKTEQALVTRLIEYVANEKHYSLRAVRVWGGARFQTYDLPVASVDTNGPAALHFLLLDCSSQDRVVSEIAERYKGLIADGFTEIVGMRDLYPDFQKEEHDRLLAGSLKNMPSEPVAPQLILAVMEIEAWFIAEKSHFTRRHIDLTDAHIMASTGLSLDDSSEEIDHPAGVLTEIYGLVGLSYGKSTKDVADAVAALDISVYASGADNRAPGSQKLYSFITSLF